MPKFDSSCGYVARKDEEKLRQAKAEDDYKKIEDLPKAKTTKEQHVTGSTRNIDPEQN